MNAPLDPSAPSMRLWQALIGHGVPEDEAAGLMNGYAHELAEKIRRSEVVDISTAVRSEYGRGLHAGADLIDPRSAP